MIKSQSYYFFKEFRLVKSLLVLLLVQFFIPKTNHSFSEFPNKADAFEIDVIGNVFFVKGAELQKYSPDARLLNTYSNQLLGNISSIDLSDAMNVMVFYREMNQVILLDNQLSIKNSPIDLIDLGYSQVDLACLSYNNAFWIYDAMGNELLRFDKTLQKTDQSGNLFAVTSFNLNPVQMLERNNRLFLRDKQNGIFIFDKYGAFIKRLPIPNLEDFEVLDDQYLLLRSDTLFLYHSIIQSVDTFVLPAHNIKEIRLRNDMMYLINKDKAFEIKKITSANSH
jgi:hypothetical protein